MMAPCRTRRSSFLRFGLPVNMMRPRWWAATALVWCSLSSRGATCQISALPKMWVNSLAARELTSSLFVAATSWPMPVRSSSSSTYSERMLARLAGMPAMDAAATFEKFVSSMRTSCPSSWRVLAMSLVQVLAPAKRMPRGFLVASPSLLASGAASRP